MKKNKWLKAAMVILTSVVLTGCSSMRFVATGAEFKQICEDNGLLVQEASSVLDVDESYMSLSDAYLATTEDASCSIWYVRFTDSKEAQSYYDHLTEQMEGELYSGPNYQAEIEVVEDQCREIYMESGRIIYAEGDSETILSMENQLIGTWSADSEKQMLQGMQ